MMWQPIETAPRDGAIVLVADDTYFCAGYIAVDIAPDTIIDDARFYREYEEWKARVGYDVWKPSDSYAEPAPKGQRIPNPDAGKRTERWVTIGRSAFSDVDTHDYDGPVDFEPTHWSSALEPPSNPP